MATGFTVLDAINKNSKAGIDESPKARFRTKDISIYKMYRNDMNFYKVADVEELAGDILLHGLKQNLELVYEPCDLGEYRIVSGERRWEALKLLVTKGHREFEIATCKLTSPQDADEEQVEIISANAYRVKSIAETIEEEQRLKASLERMRAAGRTIKGYNLDSGRLRDVIASMLKMSKTKVAQIESVSNNLIPEFKEEMNKERLTFSAAYALSGMSSEEQREALGKYAETGELTFSDIKEMKEKKVSGTVEEEQADRKMDSGDVQKSEETTAGQQVGQVVSDSDTGYLPYENEIESAMNQPEKCEENRPGDDYEDAHPESIISLCFSCKKYGDCNVKTAACKKCDQYVNKPEAEKTEEQRYSEEQDRIDRETKKKLREMAEEECMDNIPGKEQAEKKYLRAAGSLFDRIMNGEQNFIILKNEGYKKGEKITIGEFADGKATGRTLEMIISFMEDDRTSSAIEEGYCVINVLMSLNE